MNPNLTVDLTKPTFVDAKVISSGDPIGYHAAKATDRTFRMSIHTLMDFNECPSKWRAGVPKRVSSEMEYGKLVDCLALTPDLFPIEYRVTPETYPSKEGPKPWNWNATFCKEWRAQHIGRQIITPAEQAEAQAAVDRLRGDPDIAEYLSTSETQVWLEGIYVDRSSQAEIPVRALLDLVPKADHPKYGKTIGDLKTVSTCYPYAWVKHVAAQKYHWQAAFYLDLFEAATGQDRTDFAHLLSESEPPYETARRWLSQEFVTLGRIQYTEAFAHYAICLNANHWPSYDDLPWDQHATFIHSAWRLVEPEAYMLGI